MKGEKDKKRRSNYDPKKSWYHDRYLVSLVQRNLLFVFCVLCFLCLIFSLIVIKSIVEKNSIEPYIVEVSDSSLLPVTVLTKDVVKYSQENPLVVEYFMTKYINARESYYFTSYSYNYDTVVRVMSIGAVYTAFKKFVNDPSKSVVPTLGRYGSVDVSIKQVVPKIKDNTFIFRISKKTIADNRVSSPTNYQITLRYSFDQSSMNYDDAMINPLGIKVNFYEILDERNLAN
jgi:type IV secretion system protein VirB8